MCPSDHLIYDLSRLWAPPPDLTLSQWADEYFYLSSEYSAEHGKWKTLPFQREPLNSISDPRVSRTVIKACRQILKTAAIMTACGYFAHQDPGPILVVQPGGDDAESFSKERIAPMIRDNPVLRKVFYESKGRSSSNTISEKNFPGGGLAIVGAGSPRNVARRTIRVIAFDEIDKYKPTSEGNVIPIGRYCLTTFRQRSKEIDTCTPTVQGSNIDRAYEESDQRELYVPCFACGHMQSMMLKWQTQVRWEESLPSKEKRDAAIAAGLEPPLPLTREEQARTAHYHCEKCDAPWSEAQRMTAVERGEWRAHKPFCGIAGFWISALYSPWKQLWEIVLEYLKGKDNPSDLQAFVNCTLAENWYDKGEAPEWQLLVGRKRDSPSGLCPDGVLFLTAGVDVQRDRLEIEIVGWGRNRESWSIDYRIIEGRTSQPEVWAKLALVLAETFPHETAQRLPISRTFVDSGDGTTTNDVYTWVRTQDVQRVTAIKGSEAGSGSIPVGQPSHVDIKVDGERNKDGLYIKIVKGSFFKAELYAFLKLRGPTEEERGRGLGFPPGYCHFPSGPNYGDEHFKQLTAEELIARKSRKTGRISMEWSQVRPRNEALDCRVYARAAAWDYGLDAAQEVHWADMERRIKIAPDDPKPAGPVRRVTRSSWMS